MEKKYEVKDEIGYGRYGTVYSCIRKSDGKKCAIKIDTDEDETYKDFKTEVQVYSQCKHSNIIEMVEYFENPIIHWIVFDLAKGNLFDFEKLHCLKDYNIEIFRCIAHGLKHLHDSGWAHLDLKIGNILFDTLEGLPTQYIFKISDMGNAVCKDTITNAFPGTYIYMDASIFKKDDKWTLEDSFKVDMWSLGIIAAEMSLTVSLIKTIARKQINEKGGFVEIVWSEVDLPGYILKFKQKDYKPYIKDSQPYNIVKKILVVNPAKRKDISWVIKKLTNLKN
ncbi:MAG TPA: protein kinase family protein [Saprospiraceae bacterium]|nr:protein kinase family protein [Saprospiraceae bacterium]